MENTINYTGERQTGSRFEEIEIGHLERYKWAGHFVNSEDWVLDAGCGVGYGSAHLSTICQKVTGLDIDPDAITYAKSHWQSDNTTFVASDLLGYLPQQSFDKIVCFEMIEHVVFPEVILKKLNSLLNTGGHLLASTPNQTAVPHTVLLNPFHIKHYEKEEIEALLKHCGFTDIKTVPQKATKIENSFWLVSAVKEKDVTEPDLQENEILGRTHSEINLRANEIQTLKKKVAAFERKKQTFELVFNHLTAQSAATPTPPPSRNWEIYNQPKWTGQSVLFLVPASTPDRTSSLAAAVARASSSAKSIKLIVETNVGVREKDDFYFSDSYKTLRHALKDTGDFDWAKFTPPPVNDLDQLVAYFYTGRLHKFEKITNQANVDVVVVPNYDFEVLKYLREKLPNVAVAQFDEDNLSIHFV